MSVFFRRRGDVPEAFAVSNSLTHCSSSNPATSIRAGKPYTATITMESGYSTLSVTVTMGGVDVTASVYSNGMISIAAVTGDIVITAVASSIDYKTWYLNSTIIHSTSVTFNAAFTSNSTRYTSLRPYSLMGVFVVRFHTNSSNFTTVYSSDTWANQEYRTVVFDTEPTGALRTWLEANATPI